MYTERFYRGWTSSDLETFRVAVGESDLQIYAEKNLRNEALDSLTGVRRTIREHIALNPLFQRSLTPLKS